MKILVVDDEEHIRTLLGELLEMNGYDCTLASSAADARDLLKNQEVELVLCDITMPGESGLSFIKSLSMDHPDTAAIMVTANDSTMIADVALKTGAYDYITKPFELNEVLISIANALRRRQLEVDNRIYREELEKKVAERTTAFQESEARLRAIFEAAKDVAFIMVDRAGNDFKILEFSPGAEQMLGYDKKEVVGREAALLRLPKEINGSLKNAEQSFQKKEGLTRESILICKSGERLPTLSTTYPIFNAGGEITAVLVVFVDVSERIKAKKEIEGSMQKLRKALEGSISAMSMIVETRDPYTAGHQQRVAQLAGAIALEMGLSEDQIDGIRMAGVIHDIGKISIPAEILSKPGRINEMEFNLIKMHPKVGNDILKSIEFPWPIAKMVLQHHERMDGSGYPLGLKDEEILLGARILGVADVVEAMASHRPYRPALGIDKALKEIAGNRGKFYDPHAADACLHLFSSKAFKFD